MQIKAKTLLLPANFVTLAGFILATYGAFTINTFMGVLLVVIGRLLDIVDGPVARATGSSRFGAALDAFCDKFAGLALLFGLWHYDLAWPGLLLIVFILNVSNGICTVVGERRGIAFTASSNGKHAVFLQNTGLLWFALLPHISNIALYDTVNISSWALTICGIVLGMQALRGYAIKAKIIG